MFLFIKTVLGIKATETIGETIGETTGVNEWSFKAAMLSIWVLTF